MTGAAAQPMPASAYDELEPVLCRARALGAEAWLVKDRADEDLPLLLGGAV